MLTPFEVPLRRVLVPKGACFDGVTEGATSGAPGCAPPVIASNDSDSEDPPVTGETARGLAGRDPI